MTVIRVTQIGEFIRHRSCERRFKLEHDGRRLARQLPFHERLFNTLDPVLQKQGTRREDSWEEALQGAGLVDLTGFADRPSDERQTDWEAFAASLATLAPGQEAYGREVAVEAELGGFTLRGNIDFVLVLYREGELRFRLVECKASRRDRTYHRVQVAIYRMLVRALLDANPAICAGRAADPATIECVVARIDESTSQSQEILELPPIDDLEREEADIVRLLADGGTIERIIAAHLDDLTYQLDTKCDGCVFSIHCFPESARQRRLELLGLDPSTARLLRAAGVVSLDDLADLPLDGAAAAEVRRDAGFGDNLDRLVAKARTRRRTLPRGGTDPDGFPVEPIPSMWQSQLPPHEIDGRRLVRVYLSVDYDYAENRIGALSAHVTTSERQLHTTFRDEGGRRMPDPEVKERWESGRDDDDRPIYDEAPLDQALSRDVVEVIPGEWSGRYEVDSGVERSLIQGFFRTLVETIGEVAGGEREAPIHFYVWSRGEMARLIEACSRVDSRLLTHLRELLGCRESLEQLIYSCIGDDVDRRYALGWTGRGLAVVSSLRWFGRTYHWRRLIHGELVSLDSVFQQDIFDFKTDLDLAADGGWAQNEGDAVARHKFEVRSRFHDSLSAPYWRAYWGVLEDDAELPRRTRTLIARYNRSNGLGYLREYLRARTQAMRWVEEGVRFKNDEITKPALEIANLPRFTLDVDNAARAAIDFLRLDQHVKVTDWIAGHIVPPADRVSLGQSIPVRDVVSDGQATLRATLDLDRFAVDAQTLAGRCTIGPGSFVRVTPCSNDPQRGQTLRQHTRGGRTCRVRDIDWESGRVELESWFSRPTQYILLSVGAGDQGPLFDYATIDESVSDFVAGKVEARLQTGAGAYMYRWFDPENPQVPERQDAVEPQPYRELLEGLDLPGEGEKHLDGEQVAAAVDGLNSTVQLIQGPPGTGKTQTTAAALLLRILARRQPEDIILLAANTHTAIDNLLQRLDAVVDNFRARAAAVGMQLPALRLAKVHSGDVENPLGGRIADLRAKPCVRAIAAARQGNVLVIGGTTSALLKMVRELSGAAAYRGLADGFQVPMLVVDEASMMVFPHFLALATAVTRDGEILLAGDHRQLAPIVAHDWEREDRPPAVLYQPFASSYQAIANIAQNHAVSTRAIRRSALRFTFRLPPEIRELIGRLYRLDDIELDGLARDGAAPLTDGDGSWERLWRGATGLYLVLHDERESRRANAVEVAIVERVLAAANGLSDGSVGIVTPHRAQRSLLRSRLECFDGPVDVIDTVERFQGGERPTIIASATASDPAAIAANVEFILDLNRSNVAFSRAQDRLIVVCSDALLDHIPAELEHYDSAMLWKSLRALCSQLVATETVDGHEVHILTVPLTPVPEREPVAARAQ
jgi:AAA domain/PD-(D/E)XK nuclease superfamily